MICYLDTSAAMKLLVDEEESAALSSYLQAAVDDGPPLISSWLLHTELHCAAGRHPGDIDRESVGLLLGTVSLIDLTRGDLMTAAALAGRLRSHDAVHLAVAMRAGAGELITYDAELASAASATGLVVVRPS